MTSLDDLLTEVRGCTICEADLPDGCRPVVQFADTARIVIIGQAPGRRVHETGVPWNDPSGVRLRSWLDLDEATFYDPARVALVPMGFCFPGTGSGGDLPPRPECAPTWHDRLLSRLDPDRLVVLAGSYALARYLPELARESVADRVRRWPELLPEFCVMPHPSPRNRRWLAANPWFEAEAVPAIRARVHEVLG